MTITRDVRISIETLIEAIPNTQSISTKTKIPDSLRNTNQSAYNPRIVSIGPIHHNTPHLKAMELEKAAYMNRLIRRTKGIPADSVKKKPMEEIQMTDLIEKCINGVVEKLKEVRDLYGRSICYANQTKDGQKSTCTDEDLAQMMVLDGCFILEMIFYKSEVDEKDPNDPIFGNILVFRDVSHDLLLLENQIPWVILQALYNETLKDIHPDENIPNPKPLTDLVLSFFKGMNFCRCKNPTVDETAEPPPHILGLLHNCYKPIEKKPSMNKEKASSSKQPIQMKPSTKNEETTPCSATELAKVGINFKPIKQEESFCLAINFNESYFLSWLCQRCGQNILEIPWIRVDDFTEPFLRNLIAYEQCSTNIRHYITSFAFHMDLLIDTKEDVELLTSSGVLENQIGSNEDVAGLFNGICKEVVLKEFLFEKEWGQIKKYCNGFWPRNIASLKRTYFKNPWSYFSVAAALVLFVLTVVQTIYTIRAA